LLSGAVGTAQISKKTAEGSTGSLPPTDAKIETTLDNLLQEIDLWYDAVLDGNGKGMDKHESMILQIVLNDLDGSQAAVQFCAKQAALAGEQAGAGVDVVADVASDIRDMEFSQSLSILRSKEQKSKAFVDTESPSNKYRLISDYVDILRKQLGMPKLKLASRQSASARFPGARIVK
jgi:hypothetical protein